MEGHGVGVASDNVRVNTHDVRVDHHSVRVESDNVIVELVTLELLISVSEQSKGECEKSKCY